MSELFDGNNEYKNIGSLELQTGTQLNLGVIATSGNLSVTSGGLKTIATVPTGRTWVVTGVLLHLTDDTGLTSTLTASIGTGAPANNILASTTFIGMVDLDHFEPRWLTGSVAFANAGDVVSLNVTGVFGGSSVLVEVILIGLSF